jgi:hypothetical protein
MPDKSQPTKPMLDGYPHEYIKLPVFSDSLPDRVGGAGQGQPHPTCHALEQLLLQITAVRDVGALSHLDADLRRIERAARTALVQAAIAPPEC